LQFDESKLNAFMDIGAAMHATLVVIGDKLRLYKAMAGAGWLAAAELAARTGTSERYIREWLNANAASGYVAYDPETARYQLPPEQAFALTVQDLPGAFHIVSSCFKDEPKIAQAFRTGGRDAVQSGVRIAAVSAGMRGRACLRDRAKVTAGPRRARPRSARDATGQIVGTWGRSSPRPCPRNIGRPKTNLRPGGRAAAGPQARLSSLRLLRKLRGSK
jgi:hypothetical protein